MRKKSTRLLSAALAACMMLSVLPVGAFAAEPGTEPENTATAQEKTEGYHLKGGATINDDFIKKHGNIYTIGEGGDYLYSSTITIDTTKDVTIKFINDVNCDIDGTDANLRPLLKYQRSFIDAKNVGKLIISNEDNYKFENHYWGGRFLGVTAPNAIVEVNGGSYSTYALGTFYFNGCNATLTDVTVENYEYNCVYNGNATVTIDRGCYTTKITRGLYTADYSSAIKNAGGGTLNLNGVTATSGLTAVENNSGDVTINGGTYTSTGSARDNDKYKYPAVNNTCSSAYNDAQTMTILDGEFVAEGENASAIMNLVRLNQGWLKIKGGTFTASKNKGRGINAASGIISIENATITGCQDGIGCGDSRFAYDPVQVTIKDVLFADNTNDVYQAGNNYHRTDNGLYGYDYPQIEIEEGMNQIITVRPDVSLVGYNEVVGGDVEGRQFTIKTNSHYQRDLKLVCTDPDYIIAYKKDDDGEFRYFNKRETSTSFYVNAINATASIDGGTVLEPYAQLKEGTPVKLTADIPEGKKLTGWKVEKIAADGVTEMPGVVDYDHENPETATLTMPDYDVFVTAVYEDEIVDPGTGDDAADNIQGALSAVVVGAAASAIIYEAGTGIYRVINMPGIPMPSNRIELAELLWEHAGKPEPVSTALYSDIDEGDTDAQKAAHWAVEQDLMKDDADNNKFHPAFPVSKLRVCLTWNAAKEKGLFAKTEE